MFFPLSWSPSHAIQLISHGDAVLALLVQDIHMFCDPIHFLERELLRAHTADPSGAWTKDEQVFVAFVSFGLYSWRTPKTKSVC